MFTFRRIQWLLDKDWWWNDDLFVIIIIFYILSLLWFYFFLIFQWKCWLPFWFWFLNQSFSAFFQHFKLNLKMSPFTSNICPVNVYQNLFLFEMDFFCVFFCLGENPSFEKRDLKNFFRRLASKSNKWEISLKEGFCI